MEIDKYSNISQFKFLFPVWYTILQFILCSGSLALLLVYILIVSQDFVKESVTTFKT